MMPSGPAANTSLSRSSPDIMTYTPERKGQLLMFREKSKEERKATYVMQIYYDKCDFSSTI
jgi:hypothetical protein